MVEVADFDLYTDSSYVIGLGLTVKGVGARGRSLGGGKKWGGF